MALINNTHMSCLTSDTIRSHIGSLVMENPFGHHAVDYIGENRSLNMEVMRSADVNTWQRGFRDHSERVEFSYVCSRR